MHRRIFILSDLEGSSCCPDYPATTFMGPGWPRACQGMTRDADAVARALFDAGVETVAIKDFHRTGYNLFPSRMDGRARVVSGYRRGPIPGMGGTFNTTGLMMIGMHAPSGSRGFLPHTLTSRIAMLRVNGKLLSEAELFSAVLSGHGLVPLFFSGCPEACAHAAGAINGIHTFPIEKETATPPDAVRAWRRELASHAVTSLSGQRQLPFVLPGPYRTAVSLRDGRTPAKQIAKRWGLERKQNTLYFRARDIQDLYLTLIRIAYLTPFLERTLPLGLMLYHLMGWLGRARALRTSLSSRS